MSERLSFTPGPYTYELGGDRYRIGPQGHVAQRTIAVTAGYEPASETNARLLSSAPELVEALQNAVAWADSETSDNQTYREDVARWKAALAKAGVSS